jgi:hypothetical protein
MLARFYRSDVDFLHLHHRLKLTACPHCRTEGALILHGWLYGYADTDENRKSCRGRRVFCNNRKKRNNGCGHTFSVWAADKIKRLRFNAETLWAFFKLMIALDNTAQALRTLNLACSISTAYRLWKRFQNKQSHIRTALSICCAAPTLPHVKQPVAQTIAHLESAFPQEQCPITAFQHLLQISFM